jgi:hypothetical protein
MRQKKKKNFSFFFFPVRVDAGPVRADMVNKKKKKKKKKKNLNLFFKLIYFCFPSMWMLVTSTRTHLRIYVFSLVDGNTNGGPGVEAFP